MSSPYPTRTEALILDLLMSGSMKYALELVDQSEGKLKRGTVYTLLDRLENKGFLHSKAGAMVGGRRRYSITEQGRRVLLVADDTSKGALASASSEATI